MVGPATRKHGKSRADAGPGGAASPKPQIEDSEPGAALLGGSRIPLLPSLSSLFLGGLFLLAFRFPAPSGAGYLEAVMAFAFPLLLLESVLRGRSLPWAFLALLAGLTGLLAWVPKMIHVMGNLPWAIALPAAALLWVWEALGLLALLACIRWAYRRGGPAGAGLLAALGILVWEAFAYHIYPWTWGAALGGVPWMARGAAFLGTHGLSALLWGCAAWGAACLTRDETRTRVLIPAGFLAGTLLLLGFGWYLLPQGPARRLDVALVQPNFPPGTRRPGMMDEMWARTDALLKNANLPRAATPLLVLWPESSVMGYDFGRPLPGLTQEAARRRIAWLFGTEAPRLNLVRGEAPGRSSFLQAKVLPMPFGERMPGPDALRTWLDTRMGFVSAEPGTLTQDSSFEMDTPAGALRIHPLICSEALLPRRVLAGLNLAGGDLLTNHTNDGWFERSIATDLHAAQIRLRAVEAGIPLVRSTLTGKSGLFRANGHWELWGEPLSEGAWTVPLEWRPVRTPGRWAGLLPTLMALLALPLLWPLFRPRKPLP